MPRGEFSIVIAGLAVGAGVEPQLAPLATAYVLITVVSGPLLARLPDYRLVQDECCAAARNPPPPRRCRPATSRLRQALPRAGVTVRLPSMWRTR